MNVEIEITLRCNLQCPKCNRHCNFSDLRYMKDSDMSMDQIESFIEQITENKVEFDQLRILGGEPFVHPQVEEIIMALYRRVMRPKHANLMLILTNGVVPADQRLGGILKDPGIRQAVQNGRIEIMVERVARKRTVHSWMLAAPVDLGLPYDICHIPDDCGMALNAYGYWPCGPGGAIARLFGMKGIARYKLPADPKAAWPNLREALCKYCAHGSRTLTRRRQGQTTPSFARALRDARARHWTPRRL